MNYTRYNIKKKKNNNIIIILIVLIIIALILILVGNNKDKTKKINYNSNIKKVNNIEQNKNEKKKVQKFYSIQCGVFSTKESAEVLKNTLKSYGNPFIVEKDGKFKVVLGIYRESEVKTVIDTLNSKSIQNARLTYEIEEGDLCNTEIGELINANLEVLNKFINPKVKGVKTENLKKWTNSLKPLDKEGKNIKVLNSLKDYVKKLPNEVKKENVEQGYKFIYNCINLIE